MEKNPYLKGPLWDVKSPKDLVKMLNDAGEPITHEDLTNKLAREIGIEETEIKNDVREFLENGCVLSILRADTDGYVVQKDVAILFNMLDDAQ